MQWLKLLEVASGVTSVIGLCAVTAVMYLWYASRQKDRSLRGIVAGEGIVRPEGVLDILKQFTDDQARLRALEGILGYDKELSERIVEKVSSIDAAGLSIKQQKMWTRRLIVIGALMFGLSLLAARYSRVAGASSSSPTEETPRREKASIDEDLQNRAIEIVKTYFSYDTIDVEPEGIQWFDFASSGKEDEFYAVYSKDNTEYVDVFTTKRNIENLYHARAEPGLGLGAKFARIKGSAFFIATTDQGSGAVLDVYLYTYDGIGKPELIYKVNGLFEGEIFVADGQIYISGNNERYELQYNGHQFDLVPYKKRPAYGETPGTHVISILKPVKGQLVVQFDGRPIHFTKAGEVFVSTKPIRIAHDEIIVVDDNLLRKNQTRFLLDGNIEFTAGFFSSIKPTAKCQAACQAEISISYNYQTWFHIKVEVNRGAA